jgi:hypothetical protein
VLIDASGEVDAVAARVASAVLPRLPTPDRASDRAIDRAEGRHAHG